jgi:hypothetical protein
MPGERPAAAQIEAAILRLVQDCAPGRSIDPGAVARALDPDWHSLLAAVRRAAIGLAQAGRIEILRKGRPVDPAQARGVIRLRLASPVPPGTPETCPETGASP